jgi:hypothetical protein
MLDAHTKRRHIMDINALQRVFMWCTIINGAWFVFAAMICVFADDWVFRMQSKWFPVSRDAFNVVIYSFFALFKIVFLVFNVVPYVALLIVG